MLFALVQLAILGMIIQEQAGWHDPGAVAKYAGYAELNPLAAPGAVPVAANIQVRSNYLALARIRGTNTA